MQSARDETPKCVPFSNSIVTSTLSACFFPRLLPKKDWARLRKLYGVSPYKFQHWKKGYILVFFQCPQIALLREIERLIRKHRGSIYRLDIGCDARIDEIMTAEEQFVFLKEHMLLIKRSAQRILEIVNVNETIGCYWVPHAHVQEHRAISASIGTSAPS